MSDPVEREPELDRRHLVEPANPQVRLARIEARVHTAPSRARWALAAAGGTLAVAAAVALAFVATPAAPPTASWDGAPLETGDDPGTFALADGSTIEPEAASRLELVEAGAERVVVAVRRGGAVFEVARDPERTFVVRATGVTVRVIGTRFSVRHVDIDGARSVEVAVERGVVEAETADGRVRTLGAGERWSARASEVAVAPELVPPEPTEAATPAPEPVEAPEAARDSPREVAGPAAPQLFAAGAAARRAGRLREAARAYEALLREHPGDSRAALAAFELGRLRMDSLGDRAGAVAAFELVARRGGGAAFRQDAMARLVFLHDSAGRTGACRRARAAYLSAYPGGARAADVRARCP